MTEWIGDVITSQAGLGLLEELVDIGDRMAGSEGERTGSELVSEALDEAGARNVHLEQFELQGWRRGTSRIEVGETTQNCVALPRSPSGSASGELIDIGHGLPEDFEADLSGAVVLTSSDIPDWHDRYIHRREKYYRAVDAGAVAFIYRNHVEGCLPPTGSVGTADDPIGPIPAVGVSAEVGARLERRWAGEPAEVAVSADSYEATSRNVHADIGPDTEERILLTSHVDAHDIAEGAMDNGVGTAIVLDIVESLADRPEALDTRIHVVVFGAEEVGLVGSSRYAERTDVSTVKAILNNDGVGRGRDLLLYTHGFEELAAAGRSVADRFEHPVGIVPELGPHSDHWPFVRRGVPGYQVMSRTDELGRGWGHTAADTLDKVDRRTVREQAMLLTALAQRLASDAATIEHDEPERIASDLETQNLAEGMKLVGDWPF